MPKSSSVVLSKKVFLDGLQTRFYIRKSRLRQRGVAARLRITEGQFCNLLDCRCSVSPELLAGLSIILNVPSSALIQKGGARHAMEA